MKKENTKIVSIRLPNGVADFYDAKAKEVGLNRSKMLSLALRLGMFVIDDSTAKESDSDFFDDLEAAAKGVAKNAVQKR